MVHGLTRVRGHDAGRRPHLHAPRSRWPTSSTRCSTSCSTCCATTASTTSTSSCRRSREGKAVGTDEEWDEATEALRQAAADQGPRARARRGRRRVLRPEDLGAGPRRHRPHLADVHHPARLPAAAALRARVRRRRQRAPPADHDPPGPVRVDRAVLRRARRALRRRLPRVAGAGAGAGAAGARRPRRLRRRASPTGCGPRGSAPTSSRPTSRSATASARRSSRSCPTSSWSATSDVEHGTVGVNARGCESRARRPRRRLRRPPRRRRHRPRMTLPLECWVETGAIAPVSPRSS